MEVYWGLLEVALPAAVELDEGWCLARRRLVSLGRARQLLQRLFVEGGVEASSLCGELLGEALRYDGPGLRHDRRDRPDLRGLCGGEVASSDSRELPAAELRAALLARPLRLRHARPGVHPGARGCPAAPRRLQPERDGPGPLGPERCEPGEVQPQWLPPSFEASPGTSFPPRSCPPSDYGWLIRELGGAPPVACSCSPRRSSSTSASGSGRSQGASRPHDGGPDGLG